MKTITILVVLLMVFGLFIMVPATASADSSSQFCAENDDFPGFFNSHGDCVSTVGALGKFGKTPFWVGLCKLFDNFDFENQGACLSFFK